MVRKITIFILILIFTPFIKACSYGKTNLVSSQLFYSIGKSDILSIKDLIEEGANVNFKRDNGDTPLIISTKKGDFDIVNLLLANGANVNTDDNMPLKKSVSQNIRIGVTQTIDFINESSSFEANGDNMSKLVIAVFKSAMKGLRFVAGIEEAKVVKERNKETAVMKAVRAGKFEIVNLLIKNGADLNIKNRAGDTPLIIAARAGHNNIVDLLLKNNVNIDTVNHHKQTAIMISSYLGHHKIANLLIRSGAYSDIDETIAEMSIYRSLQVKMRVVNTAINKSWNSGADLTNTALFFYNVFNDVVNVLIYTNAETLADRIVKERGLETKMNYLGASPRGI